MKVLLRLWLVASVCWAGLAYWALTSAGDPHWQGVAFGPPVAMLLLGSAIKWAFGGYRAGAGN